jgi:phenylalanyl-tRNA synthetase alpha chain
MFDQFEGLLVDKNIQISHLKGILEFFVTNIFDQKRQIRLRPYHFQFTEPSFEVDISCGVCNGRGCRLCKEGWLELGGAGMVHPRVLEFGKIDPKLYTGFAFGWGIERILTLKYKIPDIRILYQNNLEILSEI